MPPEDDKPKVVPFKIVPKAAPDVKEPDLAGPKQIDQDAIKVLEYVLERVKEGEFKGIALIAGIMDERGVIMDCSTFTSNLTDEQPLAFIGMTGLLRRRIMDDMELGPVEMIGDDD